MRARRAAACLAVAVTAACGPPAEPASGPEPNAPGTETGDDSQPTEDELAAVAAAAEPADGTDAASVAAAVDSTPVMVTLVDPGREPREKLRYRLKAGQRQRMQMSMQMTVHTDRGSVPMPTMDMPFQLRVAEELPGGGARLEFAYEAVTVRRDVKLPAAARRKLEQGVAPLGALTGWSEIDSRGFTKNADIDIPPGLSPETRDMMEGLRRGLREISAPLPEEPVGPGARWVVNATIRTKFVMQQRTEVTLVRREGDDLITKSRITQTASEQPMEVASARGTQMRTILDGFEGAGEGQSRIALTSPRTSARVRAAGRARVRVHAPAGIVTASTAVETATVLAPAPLAR